LFGRSQGRAKKRDPKTPIDLDELIAMFGQAANFWEMQPQAGLLVRAWFADACRDASIRPVTEDAFQSSWSGFDKEHQHRFCLFVSALELQPVANRLPSLCSDGDATPALQVLQQLTVRLNLLTLDVLQQSDIRLEEFSRHFCAAWELKIQGERPAKSEARLHEIDFGRLMKEAEAARSSAKERLAYLRELQEKEEETRRPRRGKW
jgi:hypothetical protein